MTLSTRFAVAARTGGALAVLLGALLAAVPAFAQSQPAKRIYIVQSYEKGHVCGEPQAEGILDAFKAGGWTTDRNFTVGSYYMDTYRANATPEAMAREGQKALDEIAAFK